MQPASVCATDAGWGSGRLPQECLTDASPIRKPRSTRLPRAGLWDKPANGCFTAGKNRPYNRPTLSGLPVFQKVNRNGDVGELRGRYKSEEGNTRDVEPVTQGGASVDCRRLLGTALCTILLSSTGATDVLGQNDPATQSAMTGNGEGSLPSSPETAVEPSQGAGFSDLGFGQPRYRPRWTASAEFIILDRIGSVPYTLVETVPASASRPDDPGTEVLNASGSSPGFFGRAAIGLDSPRR